MSEETRTPPRRGRPPLPPEHLESRIRAYCSRYGVKAAANGLPPFPSGRRETRQHREWLTIYKATQRQALRSGAKPPGGGSAAGRRPQAADACSLCARSLGGDSQLFATGRGRERLRVHGRCAELLRAAHAAGPDAVARIARLLWPSA